MSILDCEIIARITHAEWPGSEWEIAVWPGRRRRQENAESRNENSILNKELSFITTPLSVRLFEEHACSLRIFLIWSLPFYMRRARKLPHMRLWEELWAFIRESSTRDRPRSPFKAQEMMICHFGDSDQNAIDSAKERGWSRGMFTVLNDWRTPNDFKVLISFIKIDCSDSPLEHYAMLPSSSWANPNELFYYCVKRAIRVCNT